MTSRGRRSSPGAVAGASTIFNLSPKSEQEHWNASVDQTVETRALSLYNHLTVSHRNYYIMTQETDIMTPVADSTLVSQPLLSPGHSGLPRAVADHQPPLHAHHRQ